MIDTDTTRTATADAATAAAIINQLPPGAYARLVAVAGTRLDPPAVIEGIHRADELGMRDPDGEWIGMSVWYTRYASAPGTGPDGTEAMMGMVVPQHAPMTITVHNVV